VWAFYTYISIFLKSVVIILGLLVAKIVYLFYESIAIPFFFFNILIPDNAFWYTFLNLLIVYTIYAFIYDWFRLVFSILILYFVHIVLHIFFEFNFFVTTENMRKILELFLEKFSVASYFFNYDIWMYRMFWDHIYLLKEYYKLYYFSWYTNFDWRQSLEDYIEYLEIYADVAQMMLLKRIVIRTFTVKVLFLFFYKLYKITMIFYLRILSIITLLVYILSYLI